MLHAAIAPDDRDRNEDLVFMKLCNNFSGIDLRAKTQVAMNASDLLQQEKLERSISDQFGVVLTILNEELVAQL